MYSAQEMENWWQNRGKNMVWEYMLNPSKIEWDLTNGSLSKLIELWDTQV